MSEPSPNKLRQQSNSQTQAGAAAQLVVNVFFVSASATEWVVKPIAFHVENDRAGTPGGISAGATQETGVEVQLEAERASNAQGQGLTVLTNVSLQDVLAEAIGRAANDEDIQAALNKKKGGAGK